MILCVAFTNRVQSYVESLRARIRELEEARNQPEPPAGLPSPSTSEIQCAPKPVREQNVTSNNQSDSPSLDYLNDASNERSTGWPGDTPSLDQVFSNDQSMSFVPSATEKRSNTAAQSNAEGNDHAELQDPDERDEECVGIGVMGTLSGDLCPECKGLKGQRSDYSGPSSVVDFDGQIRSWTVKPASGRYDPFSKEDVVPNICRCEGTQTPLLDIDLSVPLRANADTLVESYFERAHSLYPFLHQPTFMQSYLRLWEPVSSQNCGRGTKDIRGFHCLLNAVFALGSRFSPHLDATERLSTSEAFYTRVIKSLSFQLVGRGSLEFVQTLLLTAQYLQSTQLWGMCWNMAGLAVRVAQGLGLHINPSESSRSTAGQSSSLLDEEMRRRVWGGCVTLDR
jgi:hypothetical protein